MAGEPQRFPPVNKSHDLDERVARFLRVMDENKEGGFSSQVARATLDAISQRDTIKFCPICGGTGWEMVKNEAGVTVDEIPCANCLSTGQI